LVAHSKGGLDSRRFLSTHYNPKQVQVLSLHTLSTPHHGSVHADILVAQKTRINPTSQDPDIAEFLDTNGWLASFFLPKRPGLDDLQTGTARDFNAENPFLPNIKFYTHGADADTDNDGGAISVDEAARLVPDNRWVDAAKVGSLMYRLLRNVSTVNVIRHTETKYGIYKYKSQTIAPVNTSQPQDNDLSVTDTSSQHKSQIRHFFVDRNHDTIKDGASLTTVLERIRADFPVK